jgi:VanZ family protein
VDAAFGGVIQDKEPKMSASELREKPKKTLRVLAGAGSVLWAALIFVLSSIPGEGYPSHPEAMNVVAHFCLYLILAVLLTLAFNGPKRALWKSALLALVIASAYGASDELHQYFVPNRNCDPFDWVTDSCGALLGVLLTIFALSFQKVSRSRRRDAQK